MGDVFDPTGQIENGQSGVDYNNTNATNNILNYDPSLPPSNIITYLAQSLSNDSPQVDLNTETPANIALLTLENALPGPPTTLQGFLVNFTSELVSRYAFTSGEAIAAENALYQGMLQDYQEATGIVISNGQSTNSPGNYTDFTNPNNPFVQVFNAFITTHTFSSLNGWKTNSFISQFQSFLLGPGVTTSGPIVSIDTYQSYYNANFHSTTAGFQLFLNNFISQQISSQGYFLPGASIQAFQTEVTTAVTNSQNLINNILKAGDTGGLVAGTDSGKAMIINRILSLLISIVGALQNAGIAQANNLNFLTKYQNAYTALLQQMPTFLATGQGPIGTPVAHGTGTTATNDRNDINTSLNGIFTSNLQSLRDIESNDGKTEQSNINTTNDAVNQQTSMATTFLQQMSQLLGSIFR